MKHETTNQNATRATQMYVTTRRAFWHGWQCELQAAYCDLKNGGDDGLNVAVVLEFLTRANDIVNESRRLNTYFHPIIDTQIDCYMDALEAAPEPTRTFLDESFTEFWRTYYRA